MAASSHPTPLPETMLSLCTRKFGPPSRWELATLPTPKITRGDEVLVKVHAAAINPTDIGGAQGRYWPAFSVPLPFKIGYDLAGTTVAIGDKVTSVKLGQEVFCCLPLRDGDRYSTGSVSEYALTSETFVVSKPKNLTFVQAASIPLVALTAIQMFDRIAEGGVRGKTVFIPAALSGVGSVAVQMAKNVYGAKKVITTVSTTKVALVDDFLGKGVVDQSGFVPFPKARRLLNDTVTAIDYTKVDPNKTIPHNSVDYMMDSIGASFSSTSLLKKGGTIIACAGPPPTGRDLKNVSTEVPFFVELILNFVDALVKWWFGLYHVRFDSVLNKANGRQLESIRGWVEEGKIRPVVGKVLKFRDLEGIRDECMRIKNGRGGVGKVVVNIIAD